MHILSWLLRGFVFFALFSFALNNQHDAAVYWFFGYAWRAPMIFIVFAAFGLGCVVGVVAMVPRWWRRRRARPQSPAAAVEAPPASASPTLDPSTPHGI